jgi:uncharacterized hydrophobic protein (TIGR00271 family)
MSAKSGILTGESCGGNVGSYSADMGATRLQQWLRLESHGKPGIYGQIYAAAEMSSVHYWFEIVLSAGIATFGLVLNSPAVVIGAMLISPLMGPIMAAGLGLAVGDLYLTLKALVNLAASVGLAIGFSGLLVWVLPFHAATAQILSRTNPNLLDLGIALFSGLAGSIAVCRAGGGEGVTTLPGVAIAVALMPPLCTVGFGLGSGWNTRIMGGAALLFLTNLVAIVTSAFFIFLLIGMNTAAVRAQMEEGRKCERVARAIRRGRLAWVLKTEGRVHWRIAMLVVLLAAVSVPLRSALIQLTEEGIARSAVQKQVSELAPHGTLVSEQVEVGRQSIAVGLVTTRAVSDERVKQAEAAIEKRAGREADITVSTVASQSEIERLTERLTAPVLAPAVVKPAAASSNAEELVKDVGAALAKAWPAQPVLTGFDVTSNAAGLLVNARYIAARAMDATAVGLIERDLAADLKVPAVTLNAVRISAAEAAKQAAANAERTKPKAPRISMLPGASKGS